MRIAEHARRRLWERFPEIKLTLEDLFKNKNPYGVWTTQTEVFINLEYKIVFIVACNQDKQKTLVTVMSEDHYRLNFEVNGFMRKRLTAVVASVQQTSNSIIKEQPNFTFGAHLHVLPQNANAIIEAAFNGGCRRFDGAIKGFGGCPMAKDDLTGNMPTEKLLSYFTTQKENTNTSPMSFESSYNEASKLFAEFH